MPTSSHGATRWAKFHAVVLRSPRRVREPGSEPQRQRHAPGAIQRAERARRRGELVPPPDCGPRVRPGAPRSRAPQRPLRAHARGARGLLSVGRAQGHPGVHRDVPLRAVERAIPPTAAERAAAPGRGDGGGGGARRGGDLHGRARAHQGAVSLGSRGAEKRIQLVLPARGAGLGGLGVGVPVHPPHRDGGAGGLSGRGSGQPRGGGRALQRGQPDALWTAGRPRVERHPHAVDARRTGIQRDRVQRSGGQ
jgi:hypothetical protein